ncbi:MAG: PAS domain S-box protein [Polyangiaceae bacterium]|nr:PAS domain S-box protein [Polyangiaceae bacterium]
MDPTAPPALDVGELLAYVRFTERDAELVRRLGAVSDDALRRIAVHFYDRIREHEGAHAVLRDEDQVARLHVSLVAWLRRLVTGPYDAAYFARTSQVGRVHVRVGLPQRYMLLAMALVRGELGALARARLGAQAADVIDALDRLLDLELAVMLESYRDSYVERIHHAAAAEHAALSLRSESVSAALREAVELGGLLVIGVDRAGTILLVNGAVEALTGLARDELVGESLRAIVGEELLPGGAALQRLLAGGDVPLDAPVFTRAGQERTVRWRARAVDASSGVTFVLVGRDVTDELERAEARQRNERLAAVGTLAAGLAHEIRNPLNGALLHLTVLERRVQADAEAADAVATVKDEVGRLGRLVTEFLDFARPRPLRQELVGIKSACARALELTRAAASDAGVGVTLDLPEAEVHVVGDSAKLEEALTCLVQNSIEALQGVGRRGEIRLRARRQPRHVLVEVEDDGPGISDASAPVFDAFYTTKSGGTGLGLTLAHRIITDHGGAVGVTSRPEKTVFSVRLPIAPEIVSRGET